MNPPAARRLPVVFRDRIAVRFAAIGVALLATVFVPYALIRGWSKEAQDAEAWVRHTAEVSDTTAQLMYNLRDMEAATYGILAGMQTPSLPARFAHARGEVDRLVLRLEAMTQDNPAQLVRVGQVKATLGQRLPYLDRAVQETSPDARALGLAEMDRMLDEGSVGIVAGELAKVESQLLSDRSAAAAARRADIAQLQTVSMLVQLLLLAVIALLTVREVRSRRRAEHRSSDADMRSRAVFDSVREPIALLDRHLNVLLHNTAFAELYGSDDTGAPHPLAERGAGAWRDPTLRQRLGDVVNRDREIWDYEHTQRTLDGVQRQVLVNAKRITLPDDGAHVALLTVNDVTPQKMAERHALDLNRQLEGKVEQVSEINRELEAFSYSVSHDLRAPLRHIAGFAEKLRRHIGAQAQDDEAIGHYLDVISSSSARMATLIEDLLLYSRLGRHALRVQAVDMDKVVREVREILADQRPAGSIDWQVQPLPTVAGDETMLRQVWQNLLANAIKYSASREVVRIAVTHRIDGDRHEFRVADNGVGFDMAYAGKLFGVFQRLHKVSEFPGTGIGLANVRRILSRHGGTVRAEAEPQRGATFIFTLPVRQDANDTHHEPIGSTR